MQIEKITGVCQLTPGTKFLEVEAYGDGKWFQVNGPFVVVEGPTDVEPPSRRRVKEEEVTHSRWPARVWKWYMLVTKEGGDPRDIFPVAIPSSDGMTFARGEGDHSAYFMYTPEAEEKLRAFRSLDEYLAAIAV